MPAIFKRDFKAFFTSPIGYVYIGSYILVLNLAFFITNILGQSAALSGSYSFILTVMMFTTPILTMRTFSEDLKQKTDQLLLTAPVKLTGIVMGKFLSALMTFVLMLSLTLLWPLVVSMLGAVNGAEVVGNCIGLLCIGSAYIAMGVFISSLTENQLIAAVGSLGLFIALYLMDFLLSVGAATLPAWIVGVLEFVSIFGRYSSITMGLFSVADILFFISVGAVFLFLTVRRLEKRRWA